MTLRDTIAALAHPPAVQPVDGRAVTPARRRPKRNPKVEESRLQCEAKKMKKPLAS